MAILSGILEAIYNRYLATPPLSDKLVGGLHQTEAPAGVTFPYSTFQLISSVPDSFASNKNFVENCVVEFNLFDKSKAMTTLTQCYTALVNAFDFAPLTIDSHNVLSCVREDTTTERIRSSVWQITVAYRIKLELK